MPRINQATVDTATTGKTKGQDAAWAKQTVTIGFHRRLNLKAIAMAVPMGEITRALVGVRRRLCVKWGFVDMDAYEQEYRFCFFARCPYEKTDTTFRSIPLTTESFPQKEGGEAV